MNPRRLSISLIFIDRNGFYYPVIACTDYLYIYEMGVSVFIWPLYSMYESTYISSIAALV